MSFLTKRKHINLAMNNMLVRLFGSLGLQIMLTGTTLLSLLFPILVRANDNGLGLTPPLGWRSWNLYLGNVHQVDLIKIMDGLVNRTRKDHTGKLVSLCDLGYCDVGLDDTWQRCGSEHAADGMHYHDARGNPIVNLDRFPSLNNMTRHATHLGLSAGWYANNCACSDHCRNNSECQLQITQDVKALIEYGFSSLKIDGCGGETDLVLWNKIMKELFPSKAILVENCHGGDPKFKPNRTLPPAEGCPYNFYRTSSDIRNNYASIMYNLGTVEKYRKTNSSYPGCWAYPDMLQVGVRHGLNYHETRSHFGGWAIVSSPLTLSHDVNDDAVMDVIWDIISNREVLAVNQAYYGDSGGVYAYANQTTRLYSEDDDNFFTDLPIYQYLSKPVDAKTVAVLLMNSDDDERNLVANFSEIPGLDCQPNDCAYVVRDIWNHVTVGKFHRDWSVLVSSHDAAFIVLTKATSTLRNRMEGPATSQY